MKILLINYSDTGGGAAMAAVRLVNALNKNGVYARLGVLKKSSANPYVFKLPQKKKLINNPKLENIYNRIFEKIYNKIINIIFKTSNGIKHTANFHSKTDIKWINDSEYDIVNLHWISGVICNKDLAKITKPLVWTMHDSWPCCGAEHHPNIIENDTRWKEGYYRNNKPESTHGIDLCRKVWLQKKKYLANKKISFIAPSNWEKKILKESALFGNCDCTVIPNIIDTNIFHQKDKTQARSLLGIPNNKKVLGFGAAYDIDNPKSMKGSYYLLDALNKLQNPDDYYLVIFGPVTDSFTSKIQIPFFASGYISNPNILSLLYSCCDVFINPSLIENLPTTSLESICCGVSVVAFDVGGTSDIVVHNKTGYLARPYKVDEIIKGIEWCYTNNNLLNENFNLLINNKFNCYNNLQKYIKAFEDIIYQNT